MQGPFGALVFPGAGSTLRLAYGSSAGADGSRFLSGSGADLRAGLLLSAGPNRTPCVRYLASSRELKSLSSTAKRSNDLRTERERNYHTLCVDRYQTTGMFQMSSAYSRIVRSDENQAMRATLSMLEWIHSGLSHFASTARCVR